MNKRDFLRTGVLGAAVVAIGSAHSLVQAKPKSNGFTLPPLPYANNALEPYIDTRTMEIHHDKHHKAYVGELNEALLGKSEAKLPLEQLLSEKASTNTAVRNHGGGHYNHSLFWKLLSPAKGQSPGKNIADAMVRDFGSFQIFKEKFNAAALARFGSGWAWLILDKNKKLSITSTANQDNTLMNLPDVAKGFPILGLDVWEHAYYLKYQNERKDYIEAFWNVLNWAYVDKRFNEALKQ